MLSFDQSEQENKEEFIRRLIEANWSEEEALKEWERIQEEDEN